MSTLRQIEANRHNSQKSTGPTSVGQLQWRFNCTRRASQRALQELKELQAEAQAAPPALQPPSVPHSPQIGFVPAPAPPRPAPTTSLKPQLPLATGYNGVGIPGTVFRSSILP
jgi:hypothetical protein